MIDSGFFSKAWNGKWVCALALHVKQILSICIRISSRHPIKVEFSFSTLCGESTHFIMHATLHSLDSKYVNG